MNLQIARYKWVKRRWLPQLIVAAAIAMAPVGSAAANSLSDTDITIKIEEQFLTDQSVPFDMIDATTRDGIVTLDGTVDNLLARERATRIAETVRGVRSIINRIEVDPPGNISAYQLRQSIKDALLFDPVTDSYEVTVSATDKGVVVLDGTVDSWQERAITENVVMSVPGVVAIDNQIDVAHSEIRDDAEIKPEIVNRMMWDTLVDGDRIRVQVDRGRVALSGPVGSLAEKRRAVSNAWVSGVTAVDSSGLRIEEWARDSSLRDAKYANLPNGRVREAVLDALRYDPRVTSFNIDVIAKSGLITLRGVVDNVKAKQAAGHDARNTVGVITVRNLIKVRPLARVDDQTIADNVEAALSRNVLTSPHPIDVQVQDRVVRLDGVVDSHLEKFEAENIAYRAKGVVGVKNRIKVSDPRIIIDDPYIYDWAANDYSWYVHGVTTTKSDQQIAKDIRNQLLWSPFVDGSDINVQVESGVATLTGEVGSWSEFHAARDNAFEGGAVTVENKLVVN